MNKLSINLVTYNGEKYIPLLFSSLQLQTFQDFSLLVIDNRSTDNTALHAQQELVFFTQAKTFIQNKENVGFAKAHNQAFRESTSEYVLVLNQDTYLAPECLKKMIKFLNEHPRVASVAPRLMRWDFQYAYTGESSKSLTNQIDSLGLRVSRSRRVVDDRAGEWWDWKRHSEDEIKEVFGVSGACAMLRRSAIEETLLDGQMFDESYGMYKEDVDLAFRLQSAGWKSYVVLGAVACHDRTAMESDAKGDLAAAQNKKKQSTLVRYLSYKNHLATLYKNEYWQNLILDFPFILWYEMKKFGYFLLFDRAVLAGLREICKMRKELKVKRRKLKEARKVSWKEMRNWFAT